MLQSPNVVNQWISKDLIFNILHWSNFKTMLYRYTAIHTLLDFPHLNLHIYMYIDSYISASHDKSLDIHWLTTSVLWSNGASGRNSARSHVENQAECVLPCIYITLFWSLTIVDVVWPLTIYSYHMCMRATVSLSVPRQEPLHEGVSPRATVLVEGLTNWPLPELHIW